jgi:uncharacterized membrane protein
MTHLKQLLTRPLSKAGSGAVVCVFIVALAGFADAVFLTVEHYRGVIPPCTITSGCEKVLTGQYAEAFGFPVALGGAIYYMAIMVGSLIFLESKHLSADLQAHHWSILKWTLMATTLGLLASLWFVYLQAFVIGSYCQYCLGSALTSTILFVTAVIIICKNGHDENEPRS